MAVRDVSVLGTLCVYTGSFVWVYTFVLDQFDTFSPFLHHIRFEKRSDFWSSEVLCCISFFRFACVEASTGSFPATIRPAAERWSDCHSAGPPVGHVSCEAQRYEGSCYRRSQGMSFSKPWKHQASIGENTGNASGSLRWIVTPLEEFLCWKWGEKGCLKLFWVREWNKRHKFGKSMLSRFREMTAPKSCQTVCVLH